MTEQELIDFTLDYNIECHFQPEDDEVYYFVPTDILPEFQDLLGSQIVADEPIDCHMKDGYFVFDMRYICEYFGIDLNKCFAEIQLELIKIENLYLNL